MKEGLGGVGRDRGGKGEGKGGRGTSTIIVGRGGWVDMGV